MSTEKMSWTEAELRAAHKASSLPFAQIRASETCGCFSCGKVFPTAEVYENDDVAWCPHCGIDAVLPEREVPDIHRAGFLQAMNRFWF